MKLSDVVVKSLMEAAEEHGIDTYNNDFIGWCNVQASMLIEGKNIYYAPVITQYGYLHLNYLDPTTINELCTKYKIIKFNNKLEEILNVE